MMPAEGHGPADLPREATTTPGRDDALTLVVAGHDDAAKWSVPIGVRTASRWRNLFPDMPRSSGPRLFLPPSKLAN